MVVVLFGPPGAGKTTAARESDLEVFDRDDEPWFTLGEGPFRRAVAQLARRDARAVVIRAGASSSARERTLRSAMATHGFLVLEPAAVCHERVRARGRADAVTSHKAIVKWWSAFDHDDALPEWPGCGGVGVPNVAPVPVRKAPKRSPLERGYNQAHRRMRAAVAGHVRAGLAFCAKCGRPIHPRESWDLGHTDDRRSWTGPEHAACNRRAGGRVGGLKRWEGHHGDPPPPPGW